MKFFRCRIQVCLLLGSSLPLWLVTTNAFVPIATPPTPGLVPTIRRRSREVKTPWTESSAFQRRMVSLLQRNNGNPEDSEQEDDDDAPLTRFFKALYKGVTFPFPTLRQLALHPTPAASSIGKKEATDIGFSFREAVVAIIVYLGLGAVSYHSTVLREAPFSWVDALYFSVVTFTSVGYGDLCPTSPMGKVFTILFGLSGISILGIAIATIGSRLAAVESNMIQNARKASRKRVLRFMHALGDVHPFRKNGYGNDNETASSTMNAPSSKERAEATIPVTGAENDNPTPSKTSAPLWRKTFQSLFTKSVPAFSVIILGGFSMGRLEGWSLLDSVYYAFITAVTLGYGDFSPVTRPGRLWAIFFIPLAVAAAGEVLGNVATTLQERRQELYYESLMQKELNMDRLLAMDTDHSGSVSREEYVEYMLLEMGVVSQEEFEELHSQFAKLDRDGTGYLDRNDLKTRVEIKKGGKTA